MLRVDPACAGIPKTKVMNSARGHNFLILRHAVTYTKMAVKAVPYEADCPTPSVVVQLFSVDSSMKNSALLPRGPSEVMTITPRCDGGTTVRLQSLQIRWTGMNSSLV